MLTTTNLVGFAAGGEAPNLSYLGGGLVNNSVSQLTLIDQDFGAPHPDRWIIVAASSWESGTTSRTWDNGNIQVNGAAADAVFCVNAVDAANQSLTSIFGSAVPNGGTGSFRLAYSGNVQLHHVAIYRLIGMSGGAAHATNNDGANPDTEVNLNLNVPANGCLIATAQWDSTDAFTWTGATELVDVSTGSGSRHTHAYDPLITSAATPRTVTASTGVTDSGSGCAASFLFG